MSGKMLAIIVPTYNRKQYLARGLEVIMPQVIKNKDNVDLYISDNCSDDGSAEYIQSLHAKYPGLFKSKRQPKNIGADLNFLDAVSAIDAKYAVLFGDDDIILPNFVDTILTQLATHPDVGLINYNALSMSAEGRYCGVRDPYANRGVPKYYANFGEFIMEHTHYPSLVSSNVFDRQAFVDQIGKIDVEDYPGYAWFATLLFSACRKSVVYIDQPLFLFCNPTVNRWEKYAPWYYAYGLTRLFGDLEKDCPGVLGSWREAFSNSFFLPYCLWTINKYSKFYKERYDVLARYSPCDEFSRKLKVYIFRSARYCQIRYNYLPRVINLGLRILGVRKFS